MLKNGSSIFLTIAENHAINETFKDLDIIEGNAAENNGDIRLKLKEKNEYFALNSSTKSLYLLKELDRETLDTKVRKISVTSVPFHVSRAPLCDTTHDTHISSVVLIQFYIL